MTNSADKGYECRLIYAAFGLRRQFDEEIGADEIGVRRDVLPFSTLLTVL